MTCDSCGRPATAEVQVGWDRKANGGAGGGVYRPVCEECYSETDEARQHEYERQERAAGRDPWRYW